MEAFVSHPSFFADDVWVYLALVQMPDLAATTIYTIYGLYLLRPAQRADLVKKQIRIKEATGQRFGGIRSWFRKSEHLELAGDEVDN